MVRSQSVAMGDSMATNDDESRRKALAEAEAKRQADLAKEQARNRKIAEEEAKRRDQ